MIMVHTIGDRHHYQIIALGVHNLYNKLAATRNSRSPPRLTCTRIEHGALLTAYSVIVSQVLASSIPEIPSSGVRAIEVPTYCRFDRN